jgi:hypothetical protein
MRGGRALKVRLQLRLNRVLIIGVAACVAVLVSAVPAGGWSNGNNGCNSFGTHDWVLKRAIRATGNDASWVSVRVALRATDDPDCKNGIDHASGTWWPVYDRWGDEGGIGGEQSTVSATNFRPSGSRGIRTLRRSSAGASITRLVIRLEGPSR